jgi:hypothetical protein
LLDDEIILGGTLKVCHLIFVPILAVIVQAVALFLLNNHPTKRAAVG